MNTIPEMLVCATLLLPGAYLAVLSVASLRKDHSRGTPFQGRIAIVVPAHNEAAGIERTVGSLLRDCRADGAAEVVVCADNCNDATAELAHKAGARVLARENRDQRGKGHALHWTFEALRPEDFAAYLVVDADSVVRPGFIDAMRRGLGNSGAVQARYFALNSGENTGTSLAQLALGAFNRLRPRGRQALGLSAGLLGNGFGLSLEVLDRVPYTAHSIVEDLEYHLQLVEAGVAVSYADDAQVFAEMPVDSAAAATQRQRWEGGRLLMIRRQLPRLIRSLLPTRGRSLEPLLELLTPPLTYYAAMILFWLVLSISCRWLPGLMSAALAIALLTLHVVIAALLSGGLGGLWRLRALPTYALWKCHQLAGTLRQSLGPAVWVRTGRNLPQPENLS